MKNYPFVLIILSILLFTNLSCNEDDDNNNPEEQIVLTEENNLYEGDLYRLYLDDSFLSTIDEIEVVNNLLENDPNNEELLDQLETLQNNLQSIQNNIDTQNQNEALIVTVPKRPRIPPIPPQPCLSGACIPSPLLFVTISEDLASVEIDIRNPQTEEIITTVSINQFSPLPQYNNLVSATSIDLNGYTGAVIIDVQRINTNNTTINYSLNGNVF